MTRFSKYVLILLAICLFISCEEDEDNSIPITTSVNTGNQKDEFWLGSGDMKCSPIAKRYIAALNKVEVVTERCNNQNSNPRFIFIFGKPYLEAGSYAVTQELSANLSAFEVKVDLLNYDSKNYVGNVGFVSVSRSSSDSSEFKVGFSQLNLYSNTDRMNYKLTGQFTKIR